MINNNPYIIPIAEKPFRTRENTYVDPIPSYQRGIMRNYQDPNRKNSPVYNQRSSSINAFDQAHQQSNQNGHVSFHSDNRVQHNYVVSEYSQPGVRSSNISGKKIEPRVQSHEQFPAALNGWIEKIIQRLDGHERILQNLCQNRSSSKKHAGEDLNPSNSTNSLQEINSNSFVTPWDGNFKIGEQINSCKSEITELKAYMAKSASQGKRSHDEMLYQFKREILNKFGEEATKQKKNTQDFMRKQESLASTKMAEIQSELKNIDEKIRLSQKNSKVKMSGSPSISSSLVAELDLLKKQVEALKQKTDLQANKSGGRFLRLEEIQVSTERSTKNTVLVSYEEYFKVVKKTYNQGSKEIKITERRYYIDTDGYLLDSNCYYLLDSSNSRIQLTQKQISLMKQNGIMI